MRSPPFVKELICLQWQMDRQKRKEMPAPVGAIHESPAKTTSNLRARNARPYYFGTAKTLQLFL